MQLHQELLNTYPKQLWNIVKNIQENETNNMTVDPSSLLTHFRVLQECATHDNRETREHCTHYVPVLDEEITEQEVLMEIHNMKTNTVSGDDGIPPGVYKSFNEQLITLLTMLFNHIMLTPCREYPSSWSTGSICLVHKSGPTNDPTTIGDYTAELYGEDLPMRY